MGLFSAHVLVLALLALPVDIVSIFRVGVVGQWSGSGSTTYAMQPVIDGGMAWRLDR
jgi:hypothetical protein